MKRATGLATALVLGACASAPAPAPAAPATPAGVAEAPVATPAGPEYISIAMSIDVARPAAETWKKVGKVCDIGAAMKIDCAVASGAGDIGTVRKIASGRLTEVIVAKTDLSYGYTQPAVDGKWYNLFHGFLEARPVTATSSKLLYTLTLDVSNLPDKPAKDALIASYHTRYEAALAEMKTIAEAK